MSPVRPAAELTERLLDVIAAEPALRPATPAARPAAALVAWDLDAMAVDIEPNLVEVRVVATALPLPPVLDRVQRALRAVLDDSPLASARLRLVVTDLDAAALRQSPASRP